jgi:SAM-dependent methyltransferase
MATHYELDLEHWRLFPHGRPGLEFVRTMELLDRFLPPAPARVLDIGGGPGVYAAPLAKRGYEVTLIDLTDLHVERAREVSAQQPRHTFAAALGDARNLDMPDAAFDAALMFGPLYHLTEHADRIRALREGGRVLRRGGVLMAVGISRFASLLGGLFEHELHNPLFRPIVEQDLRDGQHRNPDPAGHPEFFTTAFFHHPDELAREVSEAGLRLDGLYAVEGPAWIIPWAGLTDEEREDALFAARATEREPALLGVSPHLMAVATKP